MKALSFKEPWLNSTLEKLLGLSVDTKRAIIGALESSLKEPPREGKKLSKRFWSAYGAWDSPETAEELMRSIRDSGYDRDREVDL